MPFFAIKLWSKNLELKYLYPFQNLTEYALMPTLENWQKIMIDPYWKELSKWAPFPIDYMKPHPISNTVLAKRITKGFTEFNIQPFEPEFKRTISCLPLDSEEPMTIALYPSDTDLPEGLFGTATWGNIILAINPLNPDWKEWLPFVFSHEYHHNISGHYWYVEKGGRGLEDTLLESIINEGQADMFAMSLYPGLIPSWHLGIVSEEVTRVWQIFKSAFYKKMSPREVATYTFGNEEAGIPRNAGYYFAIRIVQGYREKYPGITLENLLRTPHRTVFEESSYTQAMNGTF